MTEDSNLGESHVATDPILTHFFGEVLREGDVTLRADMIVNEAAVAVPKHPCTRLTVRPLAHPSLMLTQRWTGWMFSRSSI